MQGHAEDRGGEPGGFDAWLAELEREHLTRFEETGGEPAFRAWLAALLA